MPQGRFIQANRNPWLVRIFYYYVLAFLKKQFYAVRVKNRQSFLFRDPNQPTLCLSNHCNWWDGMVDFILTSRLAEEEKFYVMIEELHRFSFLSRLGGFSVEKDSALSALRSLEYACQLLQKDPDNLLWIYPQGTVIPQDRRPLQFAGGVGYLMKKLPEINIVPVAQYYTFVKEDRPEILINVGAPIQPNRIDPAIRRNRQALTGFFESQVTELLEEIRADVTQGELEGYMTLVQGELNPFKALEMSLHQAWRIVDHVVHPQKLLKLPPPVPTEQHRHWQQ